MRILHQDARANEIKLLPETLDDLWHLYNLIDERDLVFAMTYRRGEEKSDKLRPDRSDKVRMRLGIRVQKVEFHETEDVLRVLGVIEQGPQDMGEHHTLMIGPGDALNDGVPSRRGGMSVGVAPRTGSRQFARASNSPVIRRSWA